MYPVWKMSPRHASQVHTRRSLCPSQSLDLDKESQKRHRTKESSAPYPIIMQHTSQHARQAMSIKKERCYARLPTVIVTEVRGICSLLTACLVDLAYRHVQVGGHRRPRAC